VLLSYDKITNRIGIYLNGNAVIKSEKDNADSFSKDIDLGDSITLGS